MGADKSVEQGQPLNEDEIVLVGADKSYFRLARDGAFLVFPPAENESVESVRRISRPGVLLGIEAAFEGLEAMGTIGEDFDREAFLSTLSEIWTTRNEGVEQALAGELENSSEVKNGANN